MWFIDQFLFLKRSFVCVTPCTMASNQQMIICEKRAKLEKLWWELAKTLLQCYPKLIQIDRVLISERPVWSPMTVLRLTVIHEKPSMGKEVLQRYFRLSLTAVCIYMMIYSTNIVLRTTDYSKPYDSYDWKVRSAQRSTYLFFPAWNAPFLDRGWFCCTTIFHEKCHHIKGA